MFAQFVVILALGFGLASAAVLGEDSCQVDKDFKLLQAIVKLESRVEHLEEEEKNCTSCADGWVTFYGACYYFDDTSLRNWEDSKAYCESQGAHLLVIDSKPEDFFVHDATSGLFKGDTGHHKFFWFGAEDLDHDGHWEWYDSHKEIATTYTNWVSGQGDLNPNHVENCGCLWNEDHDFLWHDCGCEQNGYVVCEKH